MESASEHLEQVEHQQHAAHSPFDRKVAMSMAILASMLAAVTLLSHRAHTETLLTQSKASDMWGFYQFKNNRDHDYETAILFSGGLSKDAINAEKMKEANDFATSKRQKYKNELPEHKKKAEEFERESRMYQVRADRFDLGELGLQLGLILCSIAVLVKRAPFWYFGIAAGGFGFVVAVTAFFIEH